MIDRLKNTLWHSYILNDGKDVAETPFEILSQVMLSSIKDIKAGYYTNEGVVDYSAIKKSVEYDKYKRLTARLRNYDLRLLKEENEIMAFWINLYNTIVVDGIIDLGIKRSVKEVTGFFSMIKYNIGGINFSPDDIEHGILRGNARHPVRRLKQFKSFDKRKAFCIKKVDPRIHFALTCGSRSCAPIKFYTAEDIADALELATKNFVNSSEVIIIPEENRILISILFKWYKNDFGGIDGVLNFIGKYIVDDDKKGFIINRKKKIIVHYLHYDWNLNV